MRRAPSKSFQLMLAHGLIVLLVAAPVSVFAWLVQQDQWQKVAEQRIEAVATSVASLASVKTALIADPAQVEPNNPQVKALGDTVEAIRIASEMDYIVVANASGIRLTHVLAGNVGKPVSTDPSVALSGEVTVGVADGNVGRTFRVKVPVKDRSGRVLGLISAGVLESKLVREQSDEVRELGLAIGGAVLAGLIAAAASSYFIRRRVYGIEPAQVAPLVAELTVERRSAEMLRASAHEFANRLHVIQGLLMQDKPEAAQQYIARLPGAARGEPGDTEQVHEPLLDAVLSAKRARARELGVSLDLDAESDASALGFAVGDDELTVLSNLISNAMEAGSEVLVGIYADPSQLHIVVQDDGPGVQAGVEVWRHGVSTKADNRGVGLSLVHDIVTRREGTLRFGIGALGGAEFEVTLPAPSRAFLNTHGSGSEPAMEANPPPNSQQSTNVTTINREQI